MSFMPFAVTNGPVFSSLEAHLRDRRRRAEVLEQLRKLAKAGALPTVDEIMATKLLPAFGGGTEGKSFDDVASHVLMDWLGYTHDEAGGWSVGPTEEHWWHDWSGKTAPTFLHGLVAALEISLGLGPDDEIDASDRSLPLTFAWTCPAPRFETHIRWAHEPTAGIHAGFVEVTFVTPGVDPTKAAFELAKEPKAHEQPNAAQSDLDGHMVVSPDITSEESLALKQQPSPLGDWGVLSLSVFSTWGPVDDEVVHRVILTERAGGVARRSWPAGQYGTLPGEIPGHQAPTP